MLRDREDRCLLIVIILVVVSASHDCSHAHRLSGSSWRASLTVESVREKARDGVCACVRETSRFSSGESMTLGLII